MSFISIFIIRAVSNINTVLTLMSNSNPELGLFSNYMATSNFNPELRLVSLLTIPEIASQFLEIFLLDSLRKQENDIVMHQRNTMYTAISKCATSAEILARFKTDISLLYSLNKEIQATMTKILPVVLFQSQLLELGMLFEGLVPKYESMYQDKIDKIIIKAAREKQQTAWRKHTETIRNNLPTSLWHAYNNMVANLGCFTSNVPMKFRHQLLLNVKEALSTIVSFETMSDQLLYDIKITDHEWGKKIVVHKYGTRTWYLIAEIYH